MTTLQTTAAGLPAHPMPGFAGTGALARARRWLAAALAPWPRQDTIARLDDHLLKDIGFSRADVVPDPRERAWLP